MTGLYDKYEVYEDEEPVEDCFVLEPKDDPAAKAALLAYARTVDNIELRRDIIEWVESLRESNESE